MSFSTVLVTGGLGFIGSHTCISLLQEGFNVLIIDSLLNSSEDNFFRIKKIIETSHENIKTQIIFKKGDLRDRNMIDKIFQEFILKKQPIKSVIHLAGLKSVEDSLNNPLEYFDVNINTTKNLLEIMRKYSCSTLVFSSTATVYQVTGEKLIKEENIKRPLHPYGKSKLIIESFLSEVQSNEPNFWKIMILRYFNPVGAHTSGFIGDNPKMKASNIFPALMKVVNNEIQKFKIFGNNWPTKDGTCIRDYIHIMDLADAHLDALNYLKKNNPQIIHFNIGTGRGISVLELVSTFSKVNSLNIKYEFEPRRKGDIPFLVADNSLALNLLNWFPKRNLEDMCIDSFKWMKQNKKF